MNETNTDFWLALDKLVSESKIIIDRPKGSRHPKYPDCVYPFDYNGNGDILFSLNLL